MRLQVTSTNARSDKEDLGPDFPTSEARLLPEEKVYQLAKAFNPHPYLQAQHNPTVALNLGLATCITDANK